jgi:hypothetical protein
MTDKEQQLEQLRRRLGWEAGGPLAQISNQATDALVASLRAVVGWIRRSSTEQPFITFLLVVAAGFAAGRVGGRRHARR